MASGYLDVIRKVELEKPKCFVKPPYQNARYILCTTYHGFLNVCRVRKTMCRRGNEGGELREGGNLASTENWYKRYFYSFIHPQVATMANSSIVCSSACTAVLVVMQKLDPWHGGKNFRSQQCGRSTRFFTSHKNIWQLHHC